MLLRPSRKAQITHIGFREAFGAVVQSELHGRLDRIPSYVSMKLALAESTQPNIVTRLVEPRILLTTISGHPTVNDSERALAEFEALCTEHENPVWISDSRTMTGFDRAAIGIGRSWYLAFKKAGGRHLVMVSEWSIALMAGRAMGLGMGVRIDNAPTYPLALAAAKRTLLASE